MPASFQPARVNWIHHWNDRLFSFATERVPEFRFEHGHFVMVGLEVEDRPLLRAYSLYLSVRVSFIAIFCGNPGVNPRAPEGSDLVV